MSSEREPRPKDDLREDRPANDKIEAEKAPPSTPIENTSNISEDDDSIETEPDNRVGQQLQNLEESAAFPIEIENSGSSDSDINDKPKPLDLLNGLIKRKNKRRRLIMGISKKNREEWEAVREEVSRQLTEFNLVATEQERDEIINLLTNIILLDDDTSKHLSSQPQ